MASASAVAREVVEDKCLAKGALSVLALCSGEDRPAVTSAELEFQSESRLRLFDQAAVLESLSLPNDGGARIILVVRFFMRARCGVSSRQREDQKRQDIEERVDATYQTMGTRSTPPVHSVISRCHRFLSRSGVSS